MLDLAGKIHHYKWLGQVSNKSAGRESCVCVEITKIAGHKMVKFGKGAEVHRARSERGFTRANEPREDVGERPFPVLKMVSESSLQKKPKPEIQPVWHPQQKG